MVIVRLSITPSANRNTYSVATFFAPIPRVEALRTSTLGYVIATPLPFRVSSRRAGDLRFRVAGGAYRLRRTAYIIDQGKTTPHLYLELCNRNSITFPRRIAPCR